jgi:hypothetical protein
MMEGSGAGSVILFLIFLLFFFIAGLGVASHLLMSPILYFWEMSGLEPRELPWQAGATNLATHLPISYFMEAKQDTVPVHY